MGFPTLQALGACVQGIFWHGNLCKALLNILYTARDCMIL